MINTFTIKENKPYARVFIDKENIIDSIYKIIEVNLNYENNLTDDQYKKLQDVMYNEKIYDKIKEIYETCNESIDYIKKF